MSDESRELKPGEREDGGAAASAQEAFDALRVTVETLARELGGEMTVMRKGLEAAFEQFETYQQPVDYGAELGRITGQLGLVAQHLDAVEKSPLLKNGPEHHARALAHAGESLVKTAAQQIERQASDLERAAVNIAGYTQSARDRKNQDARLWMARGVGVAGGILLVLLLPRFLPFSADSHIASLVMGQDRWYAGIAMMRAENPQATNELADASRLHRDNIEAIAKCREVAQQAKKDQKCTIIVKAMVQ